MGIRVVGKKAGRPDYSLEVERTAQPRFTIEQERIWGWSETTIGAGETITWIVWNAPETPSGAAGDAIYKENTAWQVRDFLIDFDADTLVNARVGICWWDGSTIWVTGEVRGFGYQRADMRLTDGLTVHHSADLNKPYGFFIQVTNPDTASKTVRMWVNGYTFLTTYFPTPTGSVKLSLKNVIKLEELPKTAEDYQAMLAIGDKMKVFRVKK